MAVKKDTKTGKWMFYGIFPKSHQNSGKQYKKRGFNTKKEAILAEEIFREEANHPEQFITIKQLNDEFLIYMSKRIKESSLVDCSNVTKKIVSVFGEKKLTSLTANELQVFFDEMDAQFSKKYVSKIYYTFNRMLNYSLKKGLISYSPLKQVELDARKNETKKEMLFWEPSEFETFIEYVDHPMYKTVFSFLYYMGCRRGEMMAITWNDINFNNNTVRINKSVAVKLNNRVTAPKTQNSIRTITMPKKLSELLIEWECRVKTFQTYDSDGLVFSVGGNPIPAETLRRYFSKYIQLANENGHSIPKIRIHDLRHSHASFLINNMSAGFTDFDIAKRLGDTVQTLHSTYAHWFKSGDSGIVDFMNGNI